VTFNLNSEDSRMLNNMIFYVRRSLEIEEETLEKTNQEHLDGKIGNIKYHFERRKLQKLIQQSRDVIETMENLGNFAPSRLHIYHEIINGLNTILPLLDMSDKEKIENLFYGGITKIRENDGNTLEEIKGNSGKISQKLNDLHMIEFLKILSVQEQKFRDHDYLVNFNFNDILTNEDELTSGSDKRNLEMIQKLMSEGKLKDKYIKKNHDKIREAYISRAKATFVNGVIDGLLKIDDSTSDIDLQELRKILNSIMAKNEKTIKSSEDILSHFSDDELLDEFNKYMKEESQKIKSKESVETYSKLTYELMKAKNAGNTELATKLQSKIDELKLEVSPEEKAAITYKIESDVKKEENYRINELGEKDRKDNEKTEALEEFRKTREIALTRLTRDGRIDKTEGTIALETGEMKTVVADNKAREQLIAEEILKIQSEEIVQNDNSEVRQTKR